MSLITTQDNDLRYLDHGAVIDMKTTVQPVTRMATGYGAKLPTRYMLKAGGQWRRVYVMQYGNSGSPYVIVQGEVAHLSIDTEHDLEALTS